MGGLYELASPCLGVLKFTIELAVMDFPRRARGKSDQSDLFFFLKKKNQVTAILQVTNLLNQKN